MRLGRGWRWPLLLLVVLVDWGVGRRWNGASAVDSSAMVVPAEIRDSRF